MKDLVPAEMCVHISQGKARDQVLEVLDHFNVCVTEKDIFSRCQVRQHSCAYTSAYDSRSICCNTLSLVCACSYCDSIAGV